MTTSDSDMNTKHNISQRKYKAKKIDEIRIKDREFQKEKRLLRPYLKFEQNKKYRENNYEKIRAEWLLNSALRSGKIVKEKCRDCERIDTHGHHPDYSKPLKVIWLCPSHHKLEHIK